MGESCILFLGASANLGNNFQTNPSYGSRDTAEKVLSLKSALIFDWWPQNLHSVSPMRGSERCEVSRKSLRWKPG